MLFPQRPGPAVTRQGRSGSIGLAASLLGALLGSGCNDPLPTYVQPTVTISTIVPSTTLDTVTYSESFEEVGPDSNLVLAYPNPVTISFYAQNLYSETLYGDAVITGRAEISFESQPDLTVTLPITGGEMQPNSSYDPRTGILTLDPQAKVWFNLHWNLRDNSGRMVYHDLSNFSTLGSSGRSFYRVFSENIHVRVYLQLYSQTSMFEGDQDFDLDIKGSIVILGP
ncbi:MAG TPA: hypothetical protein VMG34_00015 [Bacteroidota bacterium]|nr:hypothetical protein [Bacteroidota bacterium]